MAENGAGVDSICHQPVPESPKLSSPPPSPLAAQRKAQELDEEIYGPRPLVEYLLFAEFDIDKGSIIRHQYPKPCGVDEGTLAENMLPEGAHLRDQDWTLWFLRPVATTLQGQDSMVNIDEIAQDPITKQALRTLELQQQCQQEASEFAVSAKCSMLDPTSMKWGPLGNSGEGSNLLTFDVTTVVTDSSPPCYDLCVESTDSDESQIGSTSDNVIKRIPLSENLQYTFRDVDLFASVELENVGSVSFTFTSREDLLAFEKLLYKLLDSAKGYVHGWTEETDEADPDMEEKHRAFEKSDRELMVCLNLVRTKKDPSVRRGAVVKALAICTSYRYVRAFREALSQTLEALFNSKSNESSIEILSRLYNGLRGIAEKKRPPTVSHVERNVLLSAFVREIPMMPCTFELLGKDFDMHLPLFTDHDEVGGVGVAPLLDTFGEQTMLIYNAILTKRRVLFIGHGLESWTVCRLVLAVVTLMRPLRGLLDRCFPYAHLTNLDFLSVGGYIAGVTNPIFEQHEEWWDILCNCCNGEVTTKTKKKTVSSVKDEEGSATSLIDSEVFFLASSSPGHEFWIRSVFRDYTCSLIDQAYGIEEFDSDTRRRLHFETHAKRLNMWKQTPNFTMNDMLRKARKRASVFGRHLATMSKHARLLQVRSKLPDAMYENIFQEFATRVRSSSHVVEFLELFPSYRGGLTPLALGLFHSKSSVQTAARVLLSRVSDNDIGARYIQNLNYMLLMAFRRATRDFEDSQQENSQAQVPKRSLRSLRVSKLSSRIDLAAREFERKQTNAAAETNVDSDNASSRALSHKTSEDSQSVPITTAGSQALRVGFTVDMASPTIQDAADVDKDDEEDDDYESLFDLVEPHTLSESSEEESQVIAEPVLDTTSPTWSLDPSLNATHFQTTFRQPTMAHLDNLPTAQADDDGDQFDTTCNFVNIMDQSQDTDEATDEAKDNR